jgi:integrase
MRTVARQMGQLFGHVPANQLTEVHLSALTRDWKERLNRWTQRSLTSGLNKILRYIATTTGGQPIHLKLPPPGKRRDRIATEAERTAIWRVASPALKFCLVCWLELGLRFSEPLRITPADWNEEKRTVRVLTKGSKERTMPVTSKLEEILRATLPADEHTPIVETLIGHKASLKDHMRREWIKAKRRAGVPFDLRVHDLRRTLATTLYRATLDPLAVSQALGHNNLSTTVNYLAPHEPEKLRAMLSNLEWRWKQ